MAEERNLEQTSTWAVAAVCFVLIAASLLIEFALHLLAKILNKRRRKSLSQAFDTIKSELMMLGFISLFLTVAEKPISKICIPKSVGETFLPCQSMKTMKGDVEEESKCEEQGKLSFLSIAGTRDLQYLIFSLAICHVISSLLTFSLGMAKMNRWESWEAETRTFEYQFSNDPRRFQLVNQTSFGKRHLKFWSEHRYLRGPACFLRQFYNSVPKVDYLTLRNGFVTAHFAEGSSFNFQKYLRRTLEKDFGVVVGISYWIWIFSVVFIFLNAHDFHNYFWLPFIPLVLLLIVGTKLQGIITKMCLDSSDKSHVVRGTLLVRPSDHFFWFGRPKLLLLLLHFILSQNSFQLAFFAWTGYKFGLRSCFHRETANIVIKIVCGVLVQFLCGYVTLPLYALVTQMGTLMKKAVFTERVHRGIKRWKAKAKKTLGTESVSSARRSLDASVTSLDASRRSFSVRDVLGSIELDNSSVDGGFVNVDLGDEDTTAAAGKR